jgi:hypothetical protein
MKRHWQEDELCENWFFGEPAAFDRNVKYGDF